jgi:succinate dehydrogenase (ubiquinone) flavoprotein subunit
MQKAMQSDAAVFRYVPQHTLYETHHDRCDYSTQKSLDEGVEKMREIYTSYDQVGIKDRSMIWNSWVFLVNMEPPSFQ